MPNGEEKKREKMVAVNIVEYRGKGAVVQIVIGGIPRRFVVDNAEIKDGKVASSVLEGSPEIGEEWAEMVKFKGTPADLDRIMRVRGLFTREDIARDPTALHGAILELHADDMLALRGAKRG